MTSDDTKDGSKLLKRAYELGPPDSHIAFYRDFAETYDSTFAAGLGYIYPAGIVASLAAQDRPDGAILDIGCGTGLVATAIRRSDPDAVIDGVDISPEMLEKARKKGDYRDLMQADLTDDFSHVPSGYAAIVSAGTFTFGHLGPEVIPGMLDLCCSGAVAALGVNAGFFVERGFESALEGLRSSGRIDAVVLHEVPIYDGRDKAHGSDMAMILEFTVS